jgi:hypothetical protein
MENVFNDIILREKGFEYIISLLTILFLRICPLYCGTKHGEENPEKIF